MSDDRKPFVVMDDVPPIADIDETERIFDSVKSRNRASGLSPIKKQRSVIVSDDAAEVIEMKGNKRHGSSSKTKSSERRPSSGQNERNGRGRNSQPTTEDTYVNIETEDTWYSDMFPVAGTAAGRQISSGSNAPTHSIYRDYKEKKITLHMLAREGDYRKIRKLLDAIEDDEGAESKTYVVNELDEDGLAALHYAARYSQYNTVKLLISEGADVNVKGEEDIAPLHFAARYNKSAGSAKERVNSNITKSTEFDRDRKRQTIRRSNSLPTKPAASGSFIELVRAAAESASKQVRHAETHDGSPIKHRRKPFDLSHKLAQILDANDDNENDTDITTKAEEGGQLEVDDVKQRRKRLSRQSSVEGTVTSAKPGITPRTSTTDSRHDDPQNASELTALLWQDGDPELADHQVTDRRRGLMVSWNWRVLRQGLSESSRSDGRKNSNLKRSDRETYHTTDDMRKKDRRRDRHADSPFMPMDMAGSVDDIQKAVDQIPLDTENVVSLLVKHGADPNGQDKWGQTPLHFAAMRGNLVVAHKLVNCRNIKIQTPDVQGGTPLHAACTYSEYNIAELLLRHGADPTSVDELKITPLHLAAEKGSVEMVKLLFSFVKTEKEQLNMLNQVDHELNTPLHVAVDNRHYNVAQLLLRKCCDVNAVRALNMTGLHIAAGNDDIQMCKLLIKHGAHIDNRNTDNQQPIHRAAMYGNMKIIELLHEHGADIECVDKHSFSPLLTAAREGHPETVYGLVTLGADPYITNKQDQTALHLAAANNRLTVVKMLIRNKIAGGMLHRGDRYGNVPLHIAAAKGQAQVCKYLIDHGANIDAQNEEEQSPLHLAVKYGHLPVVVILLQHDKTIVFDEDEDSQTALHVAAQYGHDVIARCLLAHGSAIEAKNNKLWTPLDIAAAHGFHRTALVLLTNNAPVDPEDKSGTTPLHLAAMNGHERIVELLIQHGANVNLLNKDSQNALDLAIAAGQKSVVRSLLGKSCWKDLLRNSVTLNDGGLITPLRKLIQRMPDMAETVFDKCMTTSGVSETEQFQIIFDYEFIDDAYFEYNDLVAQKARNQHDSSFQQVQTNTETSPFDSSGKLKAKAKLYTKNTGILFQHHPLNVMVDAERGHLLAHPLVISMLRHKWNGFGRYVYYIALLLYTIFVACLSVYVVETKAPYMVKGPNTTDHLINNDDCVWLKENNLKRETLTLICRNCLFVLAVFHLLKELMQIVTRVAAYLSYENLIEWVVYVGCILFVFDFNSCQNYSGLRLEWQWQLGTIVIFLAWMNLVLQIRKFPLFGIYVVMFTDILRTFSRFFVVFLLFIVAFALSFYTLFQDLDSFERVPLSMMKTAVMMIGEFEYDSLYSNNENLHYRLISYSLFAIFIIMMTILIMNLLVGLAVDDIKGVQDQAALTRLAMTVELVLHVESMIPERFRRRWVIGNLTMYPYKEISFFHKLQRLVFTNPSKLSTANIASEMQHDEDPIEQLKQSQEKIQSEMNNMKQTLNVVQTDQRRVQAMLNALIDHLKIPYQDELDFRPPETANQERDRDRDRR